MLYVLQVLCFGLSLPLGENDTIKDCVNVYCEWLSALTSPKICVPKPVMDDPNPYAQDILHHLLNLFVPRPGSGNSEIVLTIIAPVWLQQTTHFMVF